MKFVVAFFLYLCFHLLGGNNDAHAMAHGYNHFLWQHNGKTQQVESLLADHDRMITKSNGLVEDNDHLISVEDDDEGHEDWIKKHLLHAKYLLAFSYVFILQYQSNCQADPLPFYGPIAFSSTPKYIVQRVLRV